MPSESQQKALEVFRQHGGILRTKDALASGIHPRTLYALREDGSIKLLSRGVYQLNGLTPHADPQLIAVALRAPHGVICLNSALAFHRLTHQVQHGVSLAIKRGAEPPRIDHPPVRTYSFSGRSFSEGIETHQLHGVPVRMYGPEKTIADCFSYRNKLGLDTCIKALHLYKQQGRVDTKALRHFAEIRRVSRVLTPYLAAMGLHLDVSATVLQKDSSGQHERRRKPVETPGKQPTVKLEPTIQKPAKGASRSSSRTDSPPTFDRLVSAPPPKSTEYRFHVGDDLPITRDPAAKVSGGDILVVKTASFWNSDPTKLDQKIVVIDVAESGAPDLRLGLAAVVRAAETPDSIYVSVRVPEYGDVKIVWPQKILGREGRGLDFNGTPDFSRSESPRPTPSHTTQAAADEVAPKRELLPFGYSDIRPLIFDDDLRTVDDRKNDVEGSGSDQAEQVAHLAEPAEFVPTRASSAARGPECIRGAVMRLTRTF